MKVRINGNRFKIRSKSALSIDISQMLLNVENRYKMRVHVASRANNDLFNQKILLD